MSTLGSLRCDLTPNSMAEKPTPRRPRFHLQLRHETRERIEASQQLAAAGDARAAAPPGP